MPCTHQKCLLLVQATAQEVQVQWVENECWVLEETQYSCPGRESGIAMVKGGVDNTGEAVVWRRGDERFVQRMAEW